MSCQGRSCLLPPRKGGYVPSYLCPQEVCRAVRSDSWDPAADATRTSACKTALFRMTLAAVCIVKSLTLCCAMCS